MLPQQPPSHVSYDRLNNSLFTIYTEFTGAIGNKVSRSGNQHTVQVTTRIQTQYHPIMKHPYPSATKLPYVVMCCTMPGKYTQEPGSREIVTFGGNSYI